MIFPHSIYLAIRLGGGGDGALLSETASYHVNRSCVIWQNARYFFSTQCYILINPNPSHFFLGGGGGGGGEGGEYFATGKMFWGMFWKGKVSLCRLEAKKRNLRI